MIDLDRIEALARAAQADEGPGILTDAQLAFACALSPQIVLELVEIARVGMPLFVLVNSMRAITDAIFSAPREADLAPLCEIPFDLLADDADDLDMPFVCPGCQAFGGEPCAPGCIDSEDPEDDVPCLTCGRAECVCGQFSDDQAEAADEEENRA